MDISELVKTYTVRRCATCKEYEQDSIEAKEDELFRVDILDYTCPPCFTKATVEYYKNTYVGKSTSQPSIEDWLGWET